MKKYTKPVWAVEQVTRFDRGWLLEDICEHGVGHPNQEWLVIHDPEGKKYFGLHGCDGCCSSKRKDGLGRG